MRIIAERPGVAITCQACNSAYEIRKDDITVVKDVLLGRPTGGVLAVWKCPVCAAPASKWGYELPGEWGASELRRP